MKESLPPYSLESEEAVLGSLLIDGEAIGAVDIEAANFFSEQNQLVFTAMLNTKNQVDQLTVAHELQRMNKLDEAGGAAYLFHLTANTPTSLHLNYYADIVKKCAFNRRLISQAGQIENLGYKNMPIPDAIDSLTQLTKRLITGVQDESVLSPDKVAVDAFEFYTNSSKHQSTQTGLQPFDDVKGGYLAGEYIMLAGRTGKGKTTLALQEACHIAETKQVLFFSMEMFKQQVTNKNIARITGIPEMAIALKGVYIEKLEDRFIKHNGFTDPQWKAVLAAIDKLSKLNLYIAEGNRSLDSIRRLIEKQINSTGCDMVFIDYLGLIRERQGKDGHDRYNFLSEELSRMPKEYRIPMCVLHQMNRESEYRSGESRAPKITDLREGGEESVDLLMMLSHTDNPKLSELHILKDRLRGDPCIVTVNWAGGRYS